jgi:hypothetical protein
MVVKLNTVIEEINNDELLKKRLAEFTCTQDKDVQNFLANDAVRNEKTGETATYIDLVRNDEGKIFLKGYFAIALKVFELNEDIVKSQLKKITHGRINTKTIPAYLIGQLGKCDNAEKGYGVTLLREALKIIKEAKERVGGSFLYVDCKDALVNYYLGQGFKYLQKDAENTYNQLYMVI